MARELKVFSYTLSCSPDENEALGARKHTRQIKAVVATTTKREAIEKFGVTQSEARDYMGETGHKPSVDIAISKPGQVFAYSIDDYSDNPKYIEISRKPHVPVKRPKRKSYEEIRAEREERRAEEAARRLNEEELDYLVDMFGGANSPVAQSIAAKAALMLEDIRGE